MSRKLFSLSSCIEDVEPLFNSDSAPMESIEGFGNHLIIGSGNGTIVSIALMEESQTKENRVFVENTTVLPQGRPVIQLKALSALNRILALSDGSLFMLTLDSLKVVGPPKMRSVSCMALNERPNTDAPLSIPMAVGVRRRQIAVCELQGDRINTSLELDTDDIPLTLAYDDQCICYATASHYYVIDLRKRITRPLFPMKSEDVQPIVRRIAMDEFLLTGLHNLGMFVTADGVSNRPPISWEDDFPVDIALCQPHVIVLSRSFLSVFSVSDQELKQKIPFTGGQCVCVCEGELFVASRRRIYQLRPVPWDKQVDALLAANLVDEALDVARNAQKVGSKEEYLQRFRKIQQRCGFTKLAAGEWNEARDLLIQGRTDIREVISLYPGLLATSSTFVRAIPPLHNMADVFTAGTNDENWRRDCERFLFDLLNVCRSEPWTMQWKKEIDSALLKLASEFDHELFVSMLTTSRPSNELLSDLRSWLNGRKRHYALGLVDWFDGRAKDAMKTWDRLLSKDLTDETFDGDSGFLVDLLVQCSNLSLIIQGCGLLLKHNEESAIKALLNAPGTKDVGLDVIEKMLEGKDTALLTYMEERTRMTPSVDLQTRLGQLFIDSLSRASSDESFIEISERFRKFLFDFDSYDGDLLLRRLDADSKFHGKLAKERAILFGRLGLHERALDTIIGQCNDLTFADEYCRLFSKGRDRKFRHGLYSSLLKSLLSAQERNKVLIDPIMRLLNNHHEDVDLAMLLPEIPNHWSLESLKPFIMKNAMLHASAVKSGSIGAGIAKSRLDNVVDTERRLGSTKFVIAENSRCAACDQLFVEPTCVRCPNGTVIHEYCLRHPNLCPATQEVFSSVK